MNFKKIVALAKEGGEFVYEYGPQIAAVGSAVCFIAGIIFAAKESPDAMEALEEKLVDNPDMNPVEKAAVVVSRMPKTVASGVAGLALHIFAWKKVLDKLATVTGFAAIVTQKNAGLVEAAKEVVGPDKAREIVQVQDQIVSQNMTGKWEPDCVEKREVMYPFTVQPFGITVWKTLDEFERGHYESVKMLANNEELSAYDYFLNHGADEKPTIDCGWSCLGRSVGGDTMDIIKWCGDELRYELKLNMYKDRYPGYLVEFINQPTAAVESR